MKSSNNTKITLCFFIELVFENAELVFFSRVFKIVKHIAIRRLKTDTLNGKPIVNLPSRTVIVQKIKFSDEERKVYDAMHKDGKLIVCK